MKEFARVVWCWEDIKKVKPKWTKKQCEEWLEKHEEGLKEAMISTGWDLIYSEVNDYESRKN